ncbi:hypothetical protein, partial [Klebsiella oxytoca]|uniref:hypothetical protein n=1 Tax=Klebsiella oxytoca TaxID=571 RepID=UPI001CA383D8
SRRKLTVAPLTGGILKSHLLRRWSFTFGYRLKHGADECLSTTLYPKESGLTVSFNIQRKPSSEMAGVFASGFGLKHGQMNDCPRRYTRKKAA